MVLGRDSQIHNVSMLEHEPSDSELHEAMELAAYGYSLIMRMTFQKGLVAARWERLWNVAVYNYWLNFVGVFKQA